MMPAKADSLEMNRWHDIFNKQNNETTILKQ